MIYEQNVVVGRTAILFRGR